MWRHESVARLARRGSSGTYFDRTLTRAGERLAYNVFRDAARTEVWGDGSGGTRTVVGPRGQDVVVPLYARIAAGQDVSPGAYADTLTVTFDY